MVFSGGSIDIDIPKTNYTSGEIIKGKIVLKLDAPKEARELRIKLIALQKKTTSDMKGRRTSSDVCVYEEKRVLDGKKTYSDRMEYEFDIKVPQSAAPQPQQQPSGALGAVIGIMGALGMIQPIRWYLDATLDVPMAFDIHKSIQVYI